MSKQPTLVLTIGHSNHPLEEFLAILKTHEVQELIDVRTIPRSRHNPQFNRDSLPAELKKAGIIYVGMPELGGLRKPKADSANAGWRNPSFQGYADYMQTPEFKEGLKRLIARARKGRVAIMCAEAVPWRCHRSLIADALLVHRLAVEDIYGLGKRRPHKLTPWAHVEGKRITYPPGADAGELFRSIQKECEPVKRQR
jgi:uncharacterized protein (DUF488 family)